MPQFLRPAITAAVAAALVVPVAAPVRAGDRHWGGHRHRDRVDAGDIIAGAIIIGGIAAIASGISKSNKEKRDREWERDNSYGGSAYDDRTDAVDVCARAAEDEARRDSQRAVVRTIDSVSNEGARYRVGGVVEIERPRGWDRDKPGGTYTDRVRFRCTARNGSVLAFAFEDNYAARW